ncbi:hypothetical protein Q5O89_12300 [Peribacillus frigoritolerans]|nr:hypothetical protein [Peribacillus frigoritolerans]
MIGISSFIGVGFSCETETYIYIHPAIWEADGETQDYYSPERQ